MITYGSTTLTSYNTITKIEVYYYKSTSATSLSGGSWSTTKPTWENGKYIWQKIRTTYEGKLENGQYYSESDPVNITGQQGQQGVAGTSAYSYKLTASDTIVTISKTGTYSTDKITFSATSKQGTDNVTAYSGRFKIETTSDGITWTTRYPASGTGVDESSTTFTIPANISNIRCSLYQTGGMTVLLDIISVSIVQDGIDGIDGTSENLLMDVYVSSLTRVKAPWNRYISNASNSTITGEFIEEANLPDPNATHFLRFTDSSATTHGRGLCFYSNGTPPFINGHTYKIGCWVRKHAGEPKIAVLLGSIPGGFQKKSITNTDWEWIEWVHTFGETDSTIDTHNNTYKRLYFYFYNNNVEGSSLDMCGFRLENVQTDVSTARNLLFKTEKLTDWGITNGATIIDGIVTIPEVTANSIRGIYSTKNFNYELIRNQTAIFSVRVKAEADKICGCNLCIGLTSTEDSTTIQKYSNNYVCFTGTGNWQTICIATPINDEYFASGDGTVDYDNCWVAVKIESLGTYHNGFQIKEPQFSLGTTATAWSSAPEDVNENIQQVQDNLDNLEIGGRNLLPFKDCLSSISLPVTNQGITLIKEEDGWIRVSGTRTSSTTMASFPLWINPTGNNYNAPINNNVPQENNEDEFTLSLEIEGTPFIIGDTYTTSTHVVAYGNTSGISARIGGINGLKDTSVFPTYMSVVRYYIGVNCEGSIDGRFRVKLEKGGKATSWTPAPEDVSADIQQVQDNLDNLEIGGRNLIIGTLNPIATGGTGIYRPHLPGQITNTSGRGTCTVAEHGLRFTNTTAHWEYIYFGSSANSTEPCMLGLEAGQTYTLSADLSWKILSSDTGKANTNTYGMGAILAYSSEANPNDFVTAVSDYPLLITQADKGTDMSGRLVFTFTVPSDAIRLYLGIRANNTTASHYAIGDYLEARNLKLEKGSKATDWTPAPEDIETEITSLEEDLKTQIDEKIQTFYQTTNPADSWNEDTRSAHDGDLWYYTGDTTATYTKDNVYRYDASNNTWTVYSASGELFDKVDGKTTIYYGTTSETYTDVKIGDYLVDSTDGSSYRYDGSNWVKVTDYKTGIDAAQASADTANDKIDNLEIGGRNLLLDTAIERISPASANNSAYVMPAPMMSDYASGILNNRDDYFTYSFDYEVTGNEASNAYIYVQIRGGSVPSTSDGYYSYVLENPTGKYCCTFKLTEAQATGTYKGCGIRLKNATDGAIVRAWNIKLEKGTKATDWSPAPEDIDANIQQVQSNLDNLEIGGRNLLKIEPKRYIPTEYNAYELILSEPLEANQTYTIHLWNVDVSHSAKTEDQLGISVYYCGGSVNLGTWQGTNYFTNGHADHLILTFTPTEDNISHSNVVNATTKFIRLYNSYPNISGTRNMSIEKWKLEKGSKATDWSPAPEDTQSSINTALSQSIWYATCDTAGDILIKEATITPTIDNFTLNIGTTVNVKFENANSGDRNSLKLNVNNTGDKDIRYMNNATMVAIPSNGYIIAGGTYLFVYDGTYWVIQNLNYNTNDNYYDRRQHKNNITAVTAITAKHLIVGTSAGYKQITSTSGGSLEFDLGYPILWAYSAIEATKTSTATYEAYPSVSFSTSGAIQDGAANKMLWLKGTIRGNTFTLASANFLTTRIPTSEDGMYYIPLGIMSSATAGYFSSSNRIYAYVDDEFQPLDNAAALKATSAYETAVQARSEIVQTQETLSLQIRDISIGGANLFEKTKSFEGIANGDNTHDALTEFVYKDLTVRYANTVTFNNNVVELSAYQFTNLTSDTWYTFSFYAKGNADIGFMYAGSGNAVIDSISVSWNDETYTGFNTTSISSNIIWLTPTDKWQRYSVIFHVEEQDITALHRLIGLYARPVSDNVELITETKDILRTENGTDVHFIMEGNEISICGYKLELGNKPTDWTPSDKDKAGYDNIISQINLSQEGIAIRADKIRFEGMITANEGFSIDEDGNMTAKNGKFNGVFESYATEINENTFDLSINNGHIHFYNNDRTLGIDERHVGYIGGIRNSVSYVSGEEKSNDAIIIRLDNDCDFIIDSLEISGDKKVPEKVLRVTNHTNNYISVDFWKDHHIYNGRKIRMYGYEESQYPEIQFYRYSNDTNNYILRGSLSLHSATSTSDISDRLYLYAKNQGDDLAGDQYLYFAGKGLKYSSTGQPLRTGYVATHKYIATQQFSITDQTITKGSSQNFEIDVTRDGYTPIMCTVTATSGTGAFYLSIYHWTIIGNTVRIFTHNNSTTTDAANITIWVNVLYKLTY